MIEPGSLRRVLVANRGEIAVRIVHACRAEGIEVVVAVSDADIASLAARLADDVVHIGPPAPAQSYLRVEQVVAGALLTGCDAIHPGYGFLSEQPELAEACTAHGLVFVGPSADTIRRGGDKVAARALARDAGVAVGAGSAGAIATVDAALDVAEQVGFPVLLKAAAGGGGRGMARVASPAELTDRFTTASREATASFGDGRLYVERFVERARHVEVQVLADTHGQVVHLADRDCTIQRRFQKVVEEAPAGVPDGLRREIADAACDLARRLDYVGAGTVEFLVDLDRGEASFLEINPRVQVEHPVTESVTGIDIVREQLRIAAGQRLSIGQDDVVIRGHAIECRINAEDVGRGFVPSPGTITRWSVPSGEHIRVDTHVHDGYAVPPYYDSLLAKLIVRGRDRADAIERTRAALDAFEVTGVETTIDLHRRIMAHADVVADAVDTRWLESTFLSPQPAAI